MHELLVGTKKGLFVLRGDAPQNFSVATRAFDGQVVEFAVRDPGTGRTFASVTNGFFGPRLMWTDDVASEWHAAEGPTFPEGTDLAVERIWVVVPGESDGLLYAGVDPAALFVSRDGGESWSLNEALWAERIEGDWQPGFGGLALHSICPWPGDPQRLAIGVSAAGVWLTEDGGGSWHPGFAGLVPEYLPEEAREGTNQLCVHNMRRAPDRAERLFMQFHGSVYRSDDAGETWNDVAASLPSGFGFPLAIDPDDPDSAFVIPLTGSEDRVTPGGTVRVYGTRDGGASWNAHGDGLPVHDAWLTILRQAFGTSGAGEDLGLWFGATSGEVFGSVDAGATWSTVAPRLAPVTSVRASA